MALNLNYFFQDFFTENHIQKLPRSWTEQLQRIPPEELGYLMDLKVQKQQCVWPLSLLSLRCILQYVSLPRDPDESCAMYYLNNKSERTSVKYEKEEKNNFIHNRIKGNNFEKKFPCFKHLKLKNLFLKHVKPKKRYEIFRMAEMTAEIAEEMSVSYVVDVGSGLGHLSRIMAYGFNLNVCCLETQLPLSKQAE